MHQAVEIDAPTDAPESGSHDRGITGIPDLVEHEIHGRAPEVVGDAGDPAVPRASIGGAPELLCNRGAGDDCRKCGEYLPSSHVCLLHAPHLTTRDRLGPAWPNR